MSILFNSTVYTTFPPILAQHIEELSTEKEAYGIESTPDETSVVIETLFEHLGRIWMAELWSAIEDDADLFQSAIPVFINIIESLQRNSLTTGRWVAFSRSISSLFHTHQRATCFIGLDKVDWGVPNDSGLVSKLIAFRNRFAHGSFQAPASVIQKGHNDLEDFLLPLEGLWKQPWFIRTLTGWQGCGQTAETVTVPDTFSPNTTVIIETAPSKFMALSPFFAVDATSESPSQIQLPMWKALSVTEAMQQEQIEHWYRTYEQEYNGVIDRLPTIGQRQQPVLTDAEWEPIQVALDNANKTTLLTGYPGTGLPRILPSILERVGTAPNLMLWDIQSFELTQSAHCFINAIQKRFAPQVDTSNLKEPHAILLALRETLRSQNIVIAIDGVEYANQAYRFEPNTILDVCNWLTEMDITLLLVHHYSQNKKPIFFDTKIDWGNQHIVDPTDLFRVQKYLRIQDVSLYQRILRALTPEQPLSLFELCDKLDAEQETDTPAFEPEVEYALWHLRPLLQTTMVDIQSEESKRLSTQESIRKWTLLSPEVRP